MLVLRHNCENGLVSGLTDTCSQAGFRHDFSAIPFRLCNSHGNVRSDDSFWIPDVCETTLPYCTVVWTFDAWACSDLHA